MCAPVFAANNIFLPTSPHHPCLASPSIALSGNRIYLDISQSRPARRPESSDLVLAGCTCLFHLFFFGRAAFALSDLMPSTRSTKRAKQARFHCINMPSTIQERKTDIVSLKTFVKINLDIIIFQEIYTFKYCNACS